MEFLRLVSEGGRCIHCPSDEKCLMDYQIYKLVAEMSKHFDPCMQMKFCSKLPTEIVKKLDFVETWKCIDDLYDNQDWSIEEYGRINELIEAVGKDVIDEMFGSHGCYKRTAE